MRSEVTMSCSEFVPDAPVIGKRCLDSRTRSYLRLVAALANTLMAVYVYVTYLARLQWRRFGRLGLEATMSERLMDYLWFWELETAFEHLRIFTFSDAMLYNLEIYLLVGIPVSIVYFRLEWDRVRWLQALLQEKLPVEEAARPERWLEAYLHTITLTFVFVLLLAPFHLEVPRAHYCCAGAAFFFGFVSICLYLAAPVDFDALSRSAAAAGDTDLQAWAWRVQHRVRPVLKFVLWLHLAAMGAAVWKAEGLGDDRKALVFGILETAVVLGYQFFQGVFAVDDAMVGSPRPKNAKETRLLKPKSQQ